MKLTNSEILKAREPLRRLIDQKFPVLTSYKLAKLANKLNEQLQVIDEVRQGLVRKYGVADERGQTIVAPESECFPKFLEEFNDLMAQEDEYVVEKVKLPDDFEIEPAALMALAKFVEV